MSNSFSGPSSRALSSVLCKMIKNKGFPFNVFEMLYNSCVTSITDYAHDVIGFHQYSSSANIHTKAIRAYLGVGKSANLCGLRSEMCWLEPRSRTQVKMFRFYLRLQNMSNDRLTKKILLHDQNFSNLNPNALCWSKEICQIISRNNLMFHDLTANPKYLCKILQDSLLSKDISMFKKECKQSVKLRTYNLLFSPFIPHVNTTAYSRLCLPFIVRKRLAQLRLGVLPIKIETDRYLNVPADQRFCTQPNCKHDGDNLSYIEDEQHFIIQCHQYDDLRTDLYSKISIPGFSFFSDYDKFIYLLTCKDVAKITGQFIVDAFDKRI